MGNCCLRSDRASEEEEEERVKWSGGVVDDDESNNLQQTKRRVVRIKVVLTREELEQIMKCSISNYKGDYYLNQGSYSVEKLVGAMKLRGTRRVYEVGMKDNNDDGVSSSNNWRPALESIPEDH